MSRARWLRLWLRGGRRPDRLLDRVAAPCTSTIRSAIKPHPYPTFTPESDFHRIILPEGEFRI